MKRILLALAIASASLVTLNSCTKEYITNYLPGVSYPVEIKTNTWTQISAGSNIYSTTLPFPELDQQYYNSGTVQVALQLSDDQGYFDSYNAIPATINGIHYSFEYFVGEVVVYAEIQTNDATLDIDYPMKAKVTLTDADAGN